MALTPEEQKKMVKTHAIASVGTGLTKRDCKVWGTTGTLEFLGLTPEESGELKTNGVDRSVTRKAHKRSRWLGDRVGSSVKENTAECFLYPSRRGTALPGEPVQIINLDQKTSGGQHVRYTLQVEGRIGTFIDWWCTKSHTFNSKVVGKEGNLYVGIVPKAGAALAQP
jgi:hypothetical protein